MMYGREGGKIKEITLLFVTPKLSFTSFHPDGQNHVLSQNILKSTVTEVE